DSMKRAIDVTERRRKLQKEYNKEHGIIPKTIVKEIKNSIEITKKVDLNKKEVKDKDLRAEIDRVKGLMQVASRNLEFEKAIELREQLNYLRKLLREEK
ncbi:MAG: UvrB/UvrC motif-containing protein, partial [Clostridia bacterium]|nr:UvrB/UvrC motif-containing protein [Clostridia bacterium]